MWRPENLDIVADYYYNIYDSTDDEREICETLCYDDEGYYLATDRFNVEGELLDLSREDVVNWARNCGGELGLLMTGSSWLIDLYTAGEEDSEFFSEDIPGLTELVPAL